MHLAEAFMKNAFIAEQLALHSRYASDQFLLSLGIEPMTYCPSYRNAVLINE